MKGEASALVVVRGGFDVEASVAKLNKLARQIEGSLREACEELVRLRDNTAHGEFKHIIESLPGKTFSRATVFKMLRCADENLLDVVEQHGIAKAQLVAYASKELRSALLTKVEEGASKREIAALIPKKQRAEEIRSEWSQVHFLRDVSLQFYRWGQEWLRNEVSVDGLIKQVESEIKALAKESKRRKGSTQ